MVAGTPMYMAPEQVKGEVLDVRADLFSLGSVLYTMAAGRPPFRAATPFAVLKRVAKDEPRPLVEVIGNAPPGLVAVIARLHAKRPEDRYASARETADALARCLTEPATTPPARRSARRWVAAAAALLLAVPAVWAAIRVARFHWPEGEAAPLLPVLAEAVAPPPATSSSPMPATMAARAPYAGPSSRPTRGRARTPSLSIPPRSPRRRRSPSLRDRWS